MNVAPAEQQAGLDDLHPGGRRHAAEQHVDHHQRADDDHRDPVLEAEQQLDQLPGADHLRDQVERDDDQRARRREDAHRRLLEAERGDVGEGELAEVAQPLGEQEGDDRPADEEADRVDQPVEAADHHRRRDAEERRRRHVVAGDRQPVLEAGDAAAGGVEVGRRLGLRRRPLGDEQRADARTRANMAIAVQLVGCFCAWPRSAPAAERRRGGGQQGQAAAALAVDRRAHCSASLTTCSVSASNSLLARRT